MIDRAGQPFRPNQQASDGAAPGISADLPADRIFLSGFVREMEIGAYPEEHGVTQRLRFNVSVDVVRNTAHIGDQVGRIVNYDNIIAAIDTIASGERLNLLETLAERLAALLLEDGRARRVTIRIEKLDRLPDGATLGCEITRAAAPPAAERIRALSPEA